VVWYGVCSIVLTENGIILWYTFLFLIFLTILYNIMCCLFYYIIGLNVIVLCCVFFYIFLTTVFHVMLLLLLLWLQSMIDLPIKQELGDRQGAPFIHGNVVLVVLFLFLLLLGGLDRDFFFRQTLEMTHVNTTTNVL
jgi:hypothetical protein